MKGLAELDGAVAALEALETRVLDFEARFAGHLAGIHPRHLAGARNLLHYLALRQTDLRDLQFVLAEYGLSSLSAADAHVLSSLRTTRHAAAALLGRKPPAFDNAPVTGIGEARARVRVSADRLFGTPDRESGVSIMVTMPIEAADDAALVLEMVRAGMDCARINCSTGGPEEWARTAEHIRRASAGTGRPVRIFMDLCGPKIRTGELVPGPRVVVLTPALDARGHVVSPAPAELVPDGTRPEGSRQPCPSIPLPPELFGALARGRTLELEDARGRPSALEVISVETGRARARSWTRVFVESGLPARVRAETGGVVAEGCIGPLPEVRPGIPLLPGDTLIVHADARPGEPAHPSAMDAETMEPAHVACCQPSVIERVAVGDPFVLDDGDFRGVVREVRDGEIVVEITHVAEEGAQLRARKGINLPATDAGLHGLMVKDLEDLPHVLEHADAVNVSFVSRPEDVHQVFEALDQAGAAAVGVVFKIETRMGIDRLPSIILAAMHRPDVGIMLARGDLAAEIGWLAMARAQEDLLSLCEAAHVPVIWATQVLTQLARTGVPTRAEISDAVLSERAECVMLNKGRHIVEAIRMLDEIIESISPCQAKKRSLLPPLAVDFSRGPQAELTPG